LARAISTAWSRLACFRRSADFGAEFLAWSTVHGFAMLVIDGPLHGFARAQIDALGQRAVAMVEQGL